LDSLADSSCFGLIVCDASTHEGFYPKLDSLGGTVSYFTSFSGVTEDARGRTHRTT